MRNRTYFLLKYLARIQFFICLCLASAPLQAQLQFNITDGQVAPTPIAIANFTDKTGSVSQVGKQLSQIISDDLSSSGLFVPPSVKPKFENWTPLGAKGLLIGSAVVSSNGELQVEFVLWDVVTGKTIASAEGRADSNGIRRIAHQIADFVYEEFTGDSGYFDAKVV